MCDGRDDFLMESVAERTHVPELMSQHNKHTKLDDSAGGWDHWPQQ